MNGPLVPHYQWVGWWGDTQDRLTMRDAIRWQCEVVANRPNKDAWAGLEPDRINQRSCQDRTGFVENFCTAVAGASALDNRSRLAPRKHQDV